MKLVSWLLMPVSCLFGLAVRLRAWLYFCGFLRSYGCGKPVISIGNLTTGGTGKTPFTAWLVGELAKRGSKSVIISRGYRSANENHISCVEFKGSVFEDAKTFGDEPVLLALRTRAAVFVGRNKVEVARRAVVQEKPDVVIADDAFQHYRLKRSFDIVLLDATAPDWHLRLLPSGRLREPFSALRRADAIILTKVNLTEAARVRDMRQRALSAIRAASAREALFLEVEYQLEQFVSLETRALIEANSLKDARVVLMSGLGRPEAFTRLVEEASGCMVVGHEIFPDHHFFDDNDLAHVAKKIRQAKATKILITEKDAVKLDAKVVAKHISCEVLVSQLTLKFRGPETTTPGSHSVEQLMDELHVRLDRFAR